MSTSIRPTGSTRVAVALGLACVGVDQAANALAYRVDHPVIDPQLNSDLALGWASASSVLLCLLMAAVLGAVVIIGRWGVRDGRWPAWPVALVVAGSASNLVDRVIFGAVRDAIDIGHVVANLADGYLLVGVIAWVLTGIHSETEKRHEPEPA